MSYYSKFFERDSFLHANNSRNESDSSDCESDASNNTDLILNSIIKKPI